MNDIVNNFDSSGKYLNFFGIFGRNTFHHRSNKKNLLLTAIFLFVHYAISSHEVSAEKKMCQPNVDKCIFKGKKPPNRN